MAFAETKPRIDFTFEAPLPPKGKDRVRRGMHGQMHSTTKGRRWEEMLASAASRVLPPGQLDEPLRVDLLAVLQRPQYMLKRWKRPRPEGYGDGTWKYPLSLVWAPKKRDRDNIEKAVLDGLKSFWRDDQLVCAGDSLKAFAELNGRPRVVVRIRSLEHSDPNEEARKLGLLGPQANTDNATSDGQQLNLLAGRVA